MRCARLILISLLLVLAGCSTFKPRPNLYVIYQIQRGDSLSTIGHKYGVTPEAILQFNNIGDVKDLQIGTLINIPSPKRHATLNPRIAIVPNDKRSARLVSLSTAKKYVGIIHWPVEGAMISSNFGVRGSSLHEGVDLCAPEGTPIFAAHDGDVVYSGHGLSGYGKLIVIKGNGIASVYAHNSANKVDVGDSIAAGQKIAEVGHTGDATGPHLHFEIRIHVPRGKYVAVDPMTFFRRQ